jgi:four helix bundle protein
MRNFKNYDVWIDAMSLVDSIYTIVDKFPKKEQFSITSQMTRSAISIPSNIAERAGRSSGKEFARFLEYSLGSAYELETQLIISEKRNYLSNDEFVEIQKVLISLQKRISGLKKSVLNKR